MPSSMFSHCTAVTHIDTVAICGAYRMPVLNGSMVRAVTLRLLVKGVMKGVCSRAGALRASL